VGNGRHLQDQPYYPPTLRLLGASLIVGSVVMMMVYGAEALLNRP
jgi:hypothetical protein